MDKREKFAALDRLKLSRAEIEEYLALLEKDDVRNLKKIKTELPIVYAEGRQKIEILPYLDMKRRENVWGIKVGNVLWKKTSDYKETSWFEVKKELISCLNGDISYVPQVDDYKNAFLECAAFNRTAALLREIGIPADDWIEEWYWAQKTEDGFPHIYLFDMGSGTVFSDRSYINYAAALRFFLPG